MAESRAPYIVDGNGTQNISIVPVDPDPEPADSISADDRDILIRALHVYDAELIGMEEERRSDVQRLCERLARPGRHWIGVEDQ